MGMHSLIYMEGYEIYGWDVGDGWLKSWNINTWKIMRSTVEIKRVVDWVD